MTKFLMMAALLAAIGSVTTERANARGGSFLGQSTDLFESNGTSSSKSRKKAKGASSTNDGKRSKRGKRKK
ncbi:MAG: hypothetical protein ABJN04_13145 [Hyphomicrobiales bacterium]